MSSIDEGRKAAADGDWKAAARAFVDAGESDLVTKTIMPLKQLADAGDVEAQAMVAGLVLDYVDDTGLPLAIEYALKAAEADHPAALRTLGFMHLTGRGAETNVRRAEELFVRASDAGDPYAAFNLAGMHLAGHIRAEARDHAECLRLLRQAADGGIVQAAAVLADQLSADGAHEEALTWYVRAAEGGHPGAMYAAGCRYRDGTGTAPDPVQAVRWFLAMIDHGKGDGVHEAIQVAKQGMTEDEIRTAVRLAGRTEADATALIASRTLGRIS